MGLCGLRLGQTDHDYPVGSGKRKVMERAFCEHWVCCVIWHLSSAFSLSRLTCFFPLVLVCPLEICLFFGKTNCVLLYYHRRGDFRYLVWATVVFLAVVTDSDISEGSATNPCVTWKAVLFYLCLEIKSSRSVPS